MKEIALTVKDHVLTFFNQYQSLSEEETSVKLSESQWTLKEIVGHLVDSASNNHQRITRLQMIEKLDFPQYECESWIAVEKWISMNWIDILTLFKYYNLILANLMTNVNIECLQNIWLYNDDTLTLEFLITDYLRHLKEHILHFETRLAEVRAAS